MKKNYTITTKLSKMNKALAFLAFTFMLSGNLNAQNAMDWNGSTDTDFLNATNWNNTLVAWGSSDVTINSAPNNPVVSAPIPGTGSYINIIKINAGGHLTVSAKMWVYKIAYLGGTLTFDGAADTSIRNQARFGLAGNPAIVNVNAGSFNSKNAMIIADGNTALKKGDATLNVNGGTVSCGSAVNENLIVGNYFGIGIVNLTAGEIKPKGLTIGTNGTVNISGGKIEMPAGEVTIKGTLNVNGGLVNLLGATTINTAAAAGTINLNGGTITVGGTLNTINTVINVDSGTLVLAGDQKATMAGFITSNAIKAVAGKTLSNDFDAVANLTTVKASPTLSVEGFVADDFSVFPNPSVDGTFSITFPNGFDGAKVSIRTILGQEIYKTTVGTATTVDVNTGKELASGIYFLQIEKDGRSVTKKLVVK